MPVCPSTHTSPTRPMCVWHEGERLSIHPPTSPPTPTKQVSGHFQLNPGSPNLPLKFKAWISPRGEEAPNYVSYTMVRLICIQVG